jgi:hypothetical protein
MIAPKDAVLRPVPPFVAATVPLKLFAKAAVPDVDAVLTRVHVRLPFDAIELAHTPAPHAVGVAVNAVEAEAVPDTAAKAAVPDVLAVLEEVANAAVPDVEAVLTIAHVRLPFDPMAFAHTPAPHAVGVEAKAVAIDAVPEIAAKAAVPDVDAVLEEVANAAVPDVEAVLANDAVPDVLAVPENAAVPA